MKRCASKIPSLQMAAHESKQLVDLLKWVPRGARVPPHADLSTIGLVSFRRVYQDIGALSLTT